MKKNKPNIEERSDKELIGIVGAEINQIYSNLYDVKNREKFVFELISRKKRLHR
jgi:hypothetical protein